MTFQQWLLLYSSVSLKDSRLTSNLLDEEEEAVIPAAKLERVIEMLNRLYFLVCHKALAEIYPAACCSARAHPYDHTLIFICLSKLTFSSDLYQQALHDSQPVISSLLRLIFPTLQS